MNPTHPPSGTMTNSAYAEGWRPSAVRSESVRRPPGLARRARVTPPEQAGLGSLNPVPYSEVPKPGTSRILTPP